MPLKISIEKALDRARIVQPSLSDIISLKMLPDGQWVAIYIEDKPPVYDFDRLCYPLLECPLFDNSEL